MSDAPQRASGASGSGGAGGRGAGRGRRAEGDLSAAERAAAGARGAQLLEGFFARVGLAVRVGVTHSEEELTFALSGQLRPLRRDPEALSALTRLAQMASFNGLSASLPCSIDLGGGAARRALLEVIAADAVDVVKHTGRRAVIEGLSSAERRKIHAAATLDDAVETRSEGEGDFRFLMVSRRS